MSERAMPAGRITVRDGTRVATARACLVCSARDARLVFTGTEERFALGGIFNVVRCSRCSFTWTDIDDAFELDAWYERGYWRESSGTVPRATGGGQFLREVWRAYDGATRPSRWVRSGRVLEIGCGPGYDTREMTERGAGVIGVDASPAGVRAAARHGTSVAGASAVALPFGSDAFDTVVMSQSLEHVREPVDALIEARRVLRQGGRLLVMLPNAGSAQRSLFASRWAHWHLPYHLWHFDARSLRAVVEPAGFNISSLRTYSPGDWTLASMRMRLRARSSVLEQTAVSRAVRSALAPTLRLLDAMGRGDCLVLEARAQ